MPRRAFYRGKLGLEVEEVDAGLEIHLATGARILVYQKSDHIPATYTTLNFPVSSVERAVGELGALGIELDLFDRLADDDGIFRGAGGPIAWFRDPAGNILSVLIDD